MAVRVGDSVALKCRYDLEGESLYMVKWYKGRREFYRYVPKELPNIRVFPVPAVNVDVSNKYKITNTCTYMYVRVLVRARIRVYRAVDDTTHIRHSYST